MSSHTATRSVLRALGLAVAAVALVAACSASAATAPPPSSGVAGATSAPTVAATMVPSASAATMAASPMASTAAASSGTVSKVARATKSGIGDFLTGEDCKTLYTLATDSANKTTCTGGCATAWPPFMLDPGESTAAGTGVTVTLGTMKRPDGSTQVTANGMPLYYFASDKAAGDTNGQGVGGVWFVASATGAKGSGGGAAPSASAGYGY